MIDQAFITDNISSATESFSCKKKITNQLYTLENFLTQQALVKLYAYILNTPNKPWDLETDSDYEKMQVPRRKIAWHAESVIEELHDVMSSLTPIVNDIIKKSCDFHGLVLWEDREGYVIDWHSDNPILTATCQIYLAGPPDNPGTEFQIDNNKTHICKFAPNTGYFIDQSVIRPLHRSTGQVPPSNLRYSLFGMWK